MVQEQRVSYSAPARTSLPWEVRRPWTSIVTVDPSNLSPGPSTGGSLGSRSVSPDSRASLEVTAGSPGRCQCQEEGTSCLTGEGGSLVPWEAPPAPDSPHPHLCSRPSSPLGSGEGSFLQSAQGNLICSHPVRTTALLLFENSLTVSPNPCLLTLCPPGPGAARGEGGGSARQGGRGAWHVGASRRSIPLWQIAMEEQRPAKRFHSMAPDQGMSGTRHPL